MRSFPNPTRRPRCAGNWSKCWMSRLSKIALIVLGWIPAGLFAQGAPELRQILERLERLERENRTLAEEVHALRAELQAGRGTPQAETAAAPAAGIPERM